MAANDPSQVVRAQAAVAFGRHADATGRETLSSRFFNAQSPYIVQRGVLIGIQELPEPQRGKLFERATSMVSEHTELCKFLLELQSPYYGGKHRELRECAPAPRKINVILQQGVGIVRGSPVRFRLTYGDLDYE